MYKEETIKSDIEEALKTCKSMAQVSRQLGVDYKTIRRYAKKFGLFLPNQGGTGMYSKSLDDVLSGEKKMGWTNLRKRLIEEGVFEYKCSSCRISEWNGEHIVLELDHINGIKSDNRRVNLRLLCPNCHSQTITYKSKNKNKRSYSDDEIVTAFNKSENFNQFCVNIGIHNRGRSKMVLMVKRLEKLNLPFPVKEQPVRTKVFATPKTKADKTCKCGVRIKRSSVNCNRCKGVQQRRVARPEHAALIDDLKCGSYTSVGRKYGVSDNSVRKWVRQYELLLSR